MTDAPVRYSPDLEDVKPNEGETRRHLNEIFDTILKRTAEGYKHAVRSVHAKSHGILEGTLTIEDPTVEWKSEEAPFQRVGTIRVAPQDSWDPVRVQAVDEEMRFSVWTGLAAHQPLGNINRARKDAYRHSADFRQRFNKCPIHEPRA